MKIRFLSGYDRLRTLMNVMTSYSKYKNVNDITPKSISPKKVFPTKAEPSTLKIGDKK